MTEQAPETAAGRSPAPMATGSTQHEGLLSGAFLVDLAIAAAILAAAIGALVVGDEQPSGRGADPLAVLFLVAASGSLLARRRRPLWVLAAVTAITLGYLLLDYPGGPATVLLLLPLYDAAAAGHRTAAFFSAAIFAGGGFAFRILIENEPPVSVAITSALYVAVILHGDAVHSRRALRAATADRMRQALREKEREAARKVTEERLRVARELHDVMAHTITSMNVLAGAASDLLPENPARAAEALQAARNSARQAMDELGATIGLLRSGDPQMETEPVPGLGHLDAVLAVAREGGIRVDVDSRPSSVDLPPAVSLTVLRIVQEAITNVVRHADASRVRVAIEAGAERVVVEVEDDGVGPGPPWSTGHGLIGMRERVQAMGGELTTGRSPLGGFRLVAEIPGHTATS